jgi:hypothetical protein
MPPKIKELDVVALTADLPAEGLLRFEPRKAG